VLVFVVVWLLDPFVELWVTGPLLLVSPPDPEIGFGLFPLPHALAATAKLIGRLKKRGTARCMVS
jgi:hypothetical protein